MDTLNDILPASAARFPDKPAFIIKPGFRTRAWNYRDLADVVPRAATYFAEAGIRRGDRVVIWGVNRPEYCIAILGALHAGAIIVPVDVNSLPDHARKFAERTRASAAIVSSQTLERAKALGLPLHMMETLPDAARGRAPLPAADVGPDDLAEVVFTSGTTGEPKGVMLTHRNILSNAEAANQIFPIGPKQRLLSFIPLSHMFEQLAGFWTVLLAGASVVYPTSRQPSAVRRTFAERKVSLILITPAVVRSILLAIERQAEAQGRAELFRTLRRVARRLPTWARRILFTSVHQRFGGRFRYIVSGGAALDPALGEAWSELGVDVLQGYGTTECAPAVTFNRIERNRLGSVGVPLPGVEVRIAKEEGGEDRVGEVLVRGPNVFKGYWENEKATREVLEPDGWYHTGDLGEVDGDGFLWLRGRKKDVIVLAEGLNVYPEDIENILAADPRIRAEATPQRPEIATIVGLQREGEDVQVHAVFLLKDEKAVEAIVRDANTKLSDSQQIRGWTIWPEDDFPTTPTQKVKKKLVIESLLGMERTEKAKPAASAPAREGTDVQRIVAQVAQASPESVKPSSQLSADLGLDSLGRVELLGIIEEELGAYIDETGVEPNTTVGQLEKMVAAASDVKRETRTLGWPLHPLVRSVGLLLQQTLLWPLVRIFYKVEVTGVEKLRGLTGPVMFAPNHHHPWDAGIILGSMPLAWRWKMAIAADASDFFGSRLKGIASGIFANAFPLAREGAIRRSLELLGARLDRRFSVLIFPEGQITVGGPLQAFKTGTGLIAVEGRTPVVPMKLKVHKPSVIDRGASAEWKSSNGWRGNVEVVFGDPLSFPALTDPADATKRIEAAVAAL